jgi:putative transposase
MSNDAARKVKDREEKRREWAEFRFRVISPLVCGSYGPEEKCIIRRAILEKAHKTPDGKEWFISERTLRAWVVAYEGEKLEGLHSCQRSTRGRYTAINPEFLGEAKKLRMELRSRSIKQILRIMSVAGWDVSDVSKSTLNLHLNRLGAKKEKNYADQGATQRWQKDHINEIWQGDCSDGIWLPDPTGAKTVKQTKLITFIDDASRFCTHGEFYWNQQLPSLLDCFEKALLKYGKCAKTYTDNGNIYRSNELRSICAELGVGQLFTEKNKPEGKGKCERHYLTIQRAFYKEAQLSGIETIEELNEFFAAWLHEHYHNEKHSAIGQSPLARWQSEESLIERLSYDKVFESMKVRSRRQVNFKTSLIKLNGRLYQASRAMAGETVQARWHYRSTEQIEIWIEGEYMETAMLFTPQPDIDYSRRPRNTEQQIPGNVLDSSKNYRKQLVAQYKKTPLGKQRETGFISLNEFVELVARLLQKSFTDDEVADCAKVFQVCAPLREDFVRDLVIDCIREKGADKHVRVYLRRVQDTKQNLR